MDVDDDVIECILNFIDEPWQFIRLRCISARWKICADRRLELLLSKYLAAMRIRCRGAACSRMSLCYARSQYMSRDHREEHPRYVCARCGSPKYQIGDDACCRLRRLQRLNGCFRVGIVLIALHLPLYALQITLRGSGHCGSSK